MRFTGDFWSPPKNGVKRWFRYTWNLFVLYFGGWTLQNEALFKQNKGHLGSRYVSGWWFFPNPSEKYAQVKLDDDFPNFRGDFFLKNESTT